MIFKKITTGPLQNNIYFVIDEKTKNAIMIDCGQDAREVIDFINSIRIKVKYIVFTHNHFDHTRAINEVISHISPVTVCIHEKDNLNEINANLLLKDNSSIELDGLKLRVIHTAGHTKGSICLYIKEKGIIFTGDTLFKNATGRTDLQGGSSEEMKKSLEMLSKLPDKTKVYPGHGDETTIGEERRKFNL